MPTASLPTQVTVRAWGSPGPGRTLQVLGSLGSGASAEVWRVHGEDGRERALKCARPGFDDVLLSEARVLALLGGAGAPRLHDLFACETQGETPRVALLLELIAGGPLERASARGDRDAFVRALVLDLGTTLLELHGFGLAHGDVKPGNVVLTPEGRAILLDLGLSRGTEVDSARGGTPRYWAPEIARGEPGSARSADAYALGVLCLEMCDDQGRTLAELRAVRGGKGGTENSLEALLWSLVEAEPQERASLAFVVERLALDSDEARPQEARLRRLRRAYLSVRLPELEARLESSRGVPRLEMSGLPARWIAELAELLSRLRPALQGDGPAPTDLVLGDLGPHDRGRFLARLIGPAACHFPLGGDEDDATLVDNLAAWAVNAPFEALTLARLVALRTRALPSSTLPASTSDFAALDDVSLALGLSERPVRAELLLFLEAREQLSPALRLEAARVLRRRGSYERALLLLTGESGPALELERALSHLRLGQIPMALAELEAVANSDRPELAAYAEALLARRQVDAGDAPGALLRLENRPAIPQVCEVRALSELAQGRTNRALDALALGRSAVASDEQAARLEGVLGMVLHQSGESLEARLAFTRAAELAARSGAALEEATYLTGVSAAASDAGLFDESVQAAQRAERLFESLGREADTARAILSRASVLSLLGAESELVVAARRGSELALRHADLRCAGYFQLCLADGLREVPLRRAAAERALALLESGSEADRLRAQARLLECGAPPFAEGDDVARRVEGFEARVDWWRARAASVMERFGGAHGETILAELLALCVQGPSNVVLGPALVAGAELALQMGRPDEARRLFAEAAPRATRLLEGLSDEWRLVARELPWVQKARSLVPSEFVGEQLGDVEGLLRSLSQREGLRPLLRQILDALLLWTGVERGLLLLRAPGGRLVVRAARNLRQDDLTAEQLELSHSLAERALQEGRAVVTVDAVGDLSESHRSVHALNLRSVLALPLIARGRVLGVVYLDDRVRRGAFGPREMSWANLIGSIAALTIADERDRLELLRSARRARRAELRASSQLSRRELELEVAERELRKVREGRSLRGNYSGIVGQSAPMAQLLALVDKVAQSDVPVLITGESGSGKELIARALAENGPRKSRAFVAENCAAVPENLLESALFGHVRGAFTGAAKTRAGLFEVADGGTLLLDEIGEMSLGMQSKLLRVLQSGEIRPVGSERTRKVNVRVLGATHRKLEEMVRQGTFREDLFYRLHVIHLRVPPLRERPADILPLAEHFLRVHGAGQKRSFSPAVRLKLQSYGWPGNVRQLENEIRRLVVLAENEIVLGDLSPELGVGAAEAPLGSGLKGQVDALERRLVVEALETTRGNRTRAAEVLGVSRFGLSKMMVRLEITGAQSR